MISPHALELAQTLVRMNTVSHRSNLELIHFIRDHLAQLGVKSRLKKWTKRSQWTPHAQKYYRQLSWVCVLRCCQGVGRY